MADPISVTSGLLTLVTFGLQASQSLYQTIKGYNSHQRNVRELREELEALDSVLDALSQVITDSDSEFVALKIPVLRCGNACKDFEAILIKCSTNGTGPRTSFRDWTRLRYLGDDVTGFKNMLASYKSTITIALCNANLRTSAITTSVLNEYQGKIEDTMSDLTERLRSVDEQLDVLLERRTEGAIDSELERHHLRSEQESIQQCMSICTNVAAHIDSVRPNVVPTAPGHDATLEIATTDVASLSAKLATEQVLGRCKDNLSDLLSQLHIQMQDIAQRQRIFLSPQIASRSYEEDQKVLQEELESIKQSLKICETASQEAQPNRTNVFEDISMADDGQQVLVSTFGDLISARKITAGSRSLQWFGQMSDETLQQMLQTQNQAHFPRVPKTR
ncbi:hypothetical protein E8E11_010522 [Didymella keratinophila]|nr:hypothetical protein E8E11_010522 [Didymella keratinophila]